MIKKLTPGLLLITTLFFFSCSQQNTTHKNGISIETISMITFVIVGIAILAVYYTTKKK